MLSEKHLLIALVVTGLLGVPAYSQDTPLDAFMDTIDVRVINIETVVTDRSGQRVHGLTAEDFRLLIDGREVPIDYFTEIRDGAAAVSSDIEAMPAVMPAVDAPEPNAIATNYLVFVDDVFPIGAQRNKVLKKLGQSLSILGPQDRMSIVAFDGSELLPLTEWTQSEDRLQAALRAAAKRKAGGAFRAQELRAFAPESGFSRSDGYADLLEARIRSVVGAVTTSMRVAGQPEGRKVLLLLSGGWPYEIVSPGAVDLATMANLGFDASDPTGTDWDPQVALAWARMNTINDFWRYPRGPALYHLISDTANLLGYTVYPVDVPGLSGSGRSIETDTVNVIGTAPDLHNSTQSRSEATLLMIAKETGGRALLNDLRNVALERAVEDTRSYYWLGFRSESAGSDARHRVQVELRQKGLQARARRDYVDFSARAESFIATEAALLFGGDRPRDIQVTAGTPRRLPQSQMEVPLELSIPVDQIAILPIEGGWAAKLEISVQVMDKNKIASDVQTFQANLVSKSPPPAGVHTTYAFDVTLRRQRHDLALTLRDMLTGELLTAHTVVKP